MQVGVLAQLPFKQDDLVNGESRQARKRRLREQRLLQAPDPGIRHTSSEEEQLDELTDTAHAKCRKLLAPLGRLGGGLSSTLTWWRPASTAPGVTRGPSPWGACTRLGAASEERLL